MGIQRLDVQTNDYSSFSMLQCFQFQPLFLQLPEQLKQTVKKKFNNSDALRISSFLRQELYNCGLWFNISLIEITLAMIVISSRNLRNRWELLITVNDDEALIVRGWICGQDKSQIQSFITIRVRYNN